MIYSREKIDIGSEMHELSRRDQCQNETSLSICSGIFRNKVANELTRKRSRGDAVRKCMNSLDKIGDKKQSRKQNKQFWEGSHGNSGMQCITKSSV